MIKLPNIDFLYSGVHHLIVMMSEITIWKAKKVNQDFTSKERKKERKKASKKIRS